MNALCYELQQAVIFAKQEIKDGRATNWIIEQGELSVETDQGWSVWWPMVGCQNDGR